MNCRFQILISLALCSIAIAQAQTDSRTTTYQTPEGKLTVHSGQPAPVSYGPAPSFSQLDSRGAGFLSATEAEAYPPLANDFIHADGNRDGRISRAEYERWAKAR